MKFFNKQTLAFAIVGALASGSALAGAEIQTANTIFAKEIGLPADLTVPVEWTIGYNFNEQEVRYACIRLTGATLAGVTPEVLDAPGGATSANVSVGSVNYNSNNTVAFFTLTDIQTSPVAATAGYAVSLAGQQVHVSNYSDQVTATVGLYDNPAAAGVCADAGSANPQLIPGTGDTANLIGFKKSYAFTIDPNKLTASVDVDPSYTQFIDTTGAPAQVSNGGIVGWLSNVTLSLVANPGLIADGSRAITLADIFPASSTYSVQAATGQDFNWAASAALTASTGTAAAVTYNTPHTVASSVVNVSGGFDADLTVTSGKVANGEKIEIPVSEYTANLSVIPNPNYSLQADGKRSATVPVILSPDFDEAQATDDNAVDSAYQTAGFAGQIDQDGVRLQAPLVQVPGGWLSRLVITNTGKKDRKFFLKVYSEDGNNVTTGQLTGYVVKAESTYVIESLGDTVLQGFTAGKNKRGTIVAVVAGPQKEIKGLYQIVNPEGALSNYVMVNQDSGGH